MRLRVQITDCTVSHQNCRKTSLSDLLHANPQSYGAHSRFGGDIQSAVTCLANAVRPLHRLRQVDTAEHAVLRFLLEVLQQGPEGPARRTVLRQLHAPRAGPQQAHPVLPAPVAMMVVVTVVMGPVCGRRVMVVGTARRHQEPARGRDLQRRQPRRHRPPTEQTPTAGAAAAAIRVIAITGPWTRRGTVEEDK